MADLNFSTPIAPPTSVTRCSRERLRTRRTAPTGPKQVEGARVDAARLRHIVNIRKALAYLRTEMGIGRGGEVGHCIEPNNLRIRAASP